MREIYEIEKALKNLKVKPRKMFALWLKLKLYFGAWKMSFKGFHVAWMATTASFLLMSLFGWQYYMIRTSYAYYVSRAYEDLSELSTLISSKEASENFSFLPTVHASSIDPDEGKIQFLLAEIVRNSEVAMEMADDITDTSDVLKALEELDFLHGEELRVFGQTSEVVSKPDTLTMVNNAILAVSENGQQIQLNFLEIKGRAALISKENLDFNPTILSKQTENFSQALLKNPTQPIELALESQKTQTESILPQIIFAHENTIEAGQLSERYIKALEAVEEGNTLKAYVLLNSVDKETSYVLSAERLSIRAVEKTEVSETAIAPADGPAKITNEVNESVDLSYGIAQAPKIQEDTSSLTLNQTETVQFVGDILRQKEETASAAKLISPIPAAEKPLVIPLASETVALETKKYLWKENKSREELQEKGEKLEAEKKLLEEKKRQKEEAQDRLVDEKRQLDEKRKILEEAAKQKELEKAKQQEEEQKNGEKASRIQLELEEQNRTQSRLEEERRTLESEQKILEESAKEKSLEEQKLIEEELTKKVEEQKRIQEQLNREIEEKIRLETERREIEAEKKRLEEESRRKAEIEAYLAEEKRQKELESKRLEEEFNRREEEKAKLEAERKKIESEHEEVLKEEVKKRQSIEKTLQQLQETPKPNTENPKSSTVPMSESGRLTASGTVTNSPQSPATSNIPQPTPSSPPKASSPGKPAEFIPLPAPLPVTKDDVPTVKTDDGRRR